MNKATAVTSERNVKQQPTKLLVKCMCMEGWGGKVMVFLSTGKILSHSATQYTRQQIPHGLHKTRIDKMFFLKR